MPTSDSGTFAVVGPGYTGQRVLDALGPGAAVAVGRGSATGDGAAFRCFDLDEDNPASLDLPENVALLYTVPPPPEGDKDPRLKRFLDGLTLRPRRLVYLSTTGVYGDRKGETVTEADKPRPATGRAKRRRWAERRVLSWSEKSGTTAVVLRVPGIYGPGRLSLDRLAAGAEVLREADSTPGNRIHVDDLVRCCVAALKDETAAGICNVGDGDHRSTGAFSRAVCELAGLPPPREIGIDEARKLWSSLRLSFLTEGRIVDTTRMREVLGVTPRYADPVEGIRASLAEEA